MAEVSDSKMFKMPPLCGTAAMPAPAGYSHHPAPPRVNLAPSNPVRLHLQCEVDQREILPLKSAQISDLEITAAAKVSEVLNPPAGGDVR